MSIEEKADNTYSYVWLSQLPSLDYSMQLLFLTWWFESASQMIKRFAFYCNLLSRIFPHKSYTSLVCLCLYILRLSNVFGGASRMVTGLIFLVLKLRWVAPSECNTLGGDARCPFLHQGSTRATYCWTGVTLFQASLGQGNVFKVSK